MTEQDYIQSALQKLAEPIQVEERLISVEDVIFTKVMSKKFRKVSADDTAVERTRDAITYAINNKAPVKFSLLFGGNKLWRFDEAPEIDWAELFAVIYYLRWLKTVASVYKPGAQLDFYSQDVSVERLNNVPRSETDNYSRTFREMLEWLKPYIPEGVSIVYRRQLDEYPDSNEYVAEIEDAKEVVLKENDGKLPTMTGAQKTATELNVKLKPHQADDPDWREKVEWEHQAVFRTNTLGRYFAEPGRIPISPTPFPGLIATGSTKKSIAKFWAGVGALEHSGDSYNELVLTPKQLESTKVTWENVNLPHLSGKNFSKIRVLK